MSTLTFAINNSDNYSTDNTQSYNDLIFYGSLYKQLNRRFPNYYSSESITYPKKKSNNSNNEEEYKKLKKEIMIMQESIEALKSSKQKKLDQIEELRCLMRKVGNKTATSKEKNYIKNNFSYNYCNREKRDHSLRQGKGGDMENLKMSSGDSSTITGPDAPSGKDNDFCGEEGNQSGKEGYLWKVNNLHLSSSLNLSAQNSVSTNADDNPIIPNIINENNNELALSGKAQ